jgi:multidrug efflux system outer membrane protein
MRNIYLPMLASLILGGCAIGPDYVKPDIELPKEFRHKIDSNLTASSQKWWENINNKDLSSYINEVLINNLDAKIADTQVDYMLSQFEQTRSYLYPQIMASGSITRQKQSETTSMNYPKAYTTTDAANLSIASYELDLWGKVRRANEAARAKLLASKESRKALRLSLSISSALAFLKLQAYIEQERISAEYAKCANDRLEFAKISYKLGAISDIDLNNAVLDESNAKSSYLNYKKKLIDAQNQYNQLLGKMPQSSEIKNSESFYAFTLKPKANISSQILASRPDIAQAEQELISANAQIGVAKAAYFPSISLTGSYGFQSSEFDNLFRGDSRSWQFIPMVSLPIFTAGRIGSQVDAAKSEQKQALLNYQNKIITAFSEADSALFNYKNESEREQSIAKSEDAMNQNLKMSELKYKYGTMSMPALLATKESYLSSKLTLIDAHLSSLSASLDVIKAFGSGW